MTGDAQIEDLIKIIEDRLDDWDETMPKVQLDAYAAVLELSNDLDTTSGRIKPTVKNIRIIAKIKAELRKVIFNEAYGKQLDKLIDTFDDIAKVQNSYFSATVGKFKVPAVLAAIREESIAATTEMLGEQGVDANFINPVKDILMRNITSGGTRAEFIEQVRDYIVGVEGQDGALKRYATTMAMDSLATYNAQYMQTLSDDLGFEWYTYTGTNKKTSRPFCIELTKASKAGGCLEYIHVSQFATLLSGDICGTRVEIYDKTGLPQGMKAGTNIANFPINRGGWNCGHFLRPVPTSLVPKKYRDRFS